MLVVAKSAKMVQPPRMKGFGIRNCPILCRHEPLRYKHIDRIIFVSSGCIPQLLLWNSSLLHDTLR